MALKLRKDFKKSSYYVWFLGAKESKGLRGPEFILPVVQHLEEREKDVEPFKVTLQVSHKGMKIIQNIVSQGAKAKPKNETIKHFIPHNTITCVYQIQDVIACILLLFNPVTKCPLHVHAYRCDSLGTAGMLREQLEMLIERPENQKKFAEIESRLVSTKETKKFDSSVGSDTGTSTRESESSEERFGNDNNRITTLYDSVAAELRAKLCKKDVPILLPPRDYDTVHRQKGNLTGIELRRCLNTNIVGQNVKTGRRLESSGGSSGIGSDHPPSPDSPDANDSRFNTMDNHSTSDEEWNQQQTDVSMYLINGQSNVTLPRPNRHVDGDKLEFAKNDKLSRYHESKLYKYEDAKHFSKMKSPKDEEKILHNKFLFSERDQDTYQKQHKQLQHQKSLDRSEKYYESGCYETDRIDRYEFEERRKQVKDELKFYDNYRNQEKKCNKYYDQEDDGFEENIKYKLKNKYDEDTEGSRSRYYEKNRYYNEENRRGYNKNEDYDDRKVPVPKIRQKYPSEEPRYNKEVKPRQKFSADDPRFYDAPNDKEKHRSYDNKTDRSIRSKCSQQDVIEEPVKRRNDMRSASPEDVSPRDRFKDAKEKFLLMERDRTEQEKKYQQDDAISPKERNKRNGAERYFDFDERDIRYYEDFEEHKPKPAPRSNVGEEVRYRREPLERYRNEKYDQKRRSMFNLIEEEHKKNSNEIAKELKRRSYLESRTDDDYYRDRNYSELPESERYPGLDRDSYAFSKSSADLDKNADVKYDPKFVKNQKIKNSAGYRHSYAEPKLKMEKNTKKHISDMLHRTHSTVSTSARVGIASVQPY